MNRVCLLRFIFLNMNRPEEKLLAADLQVNSEEHQYKVRVSNNILDMSLVSENGVTGLWSISIKALSTITRASDFVMVSEEEEAEIIDNEAEEISEDTASFVERLQAKALYYEQVEQESDDDLETSIRLAEAIKSTEEAREEVVPDIQLTVEAEPNEEAAEADFHFSVEEASDDESEDETLQSTNSEALIPETDSSETQDINERNRTTMDTKESNREKPTINPKVSNREIPTINPKVVKRPENDRNKVLGTVAGALAVAGGLYALFHKKK